MFTDGIVPESLAFLKGAWEDAILLRVKSQGPYLRGVVRFNGEGKAG